MITKNPKWTTGNSGMIKQCEYCGIEYDAGEGGNSKSRKFCTVKCQRANYNARKQQKKYNVESNISNVHKCKQCGNQYVPVQKDRDTFCSRECSYAHKRDRVKVCKHCGQEYKGTPTKRTGYCSHRCYSIANIIGYESKGICAWCGKEYTMVTSTQRCCSKECARLFQNLKNRTSHIPKEKRPPSIAKCERCGEEFETWGHSSKWCSTRCENAISNYVTRCQNLGQPCNDMENIAYWHAYNKDKGICYLCGEEVHADYDRHDNLSGTVDHVIPLAKGGDHVLSNLRLAHMVCNSRKFTKMI